MDKKDMEGRQMDTTEFWLAWRKTCAFRTCLTAESLATHNRRCEAGRDGFSVNERIDPDLFGQIVEQARYVGDMSDKGFARLIRFPRKPTPLKRFQTEEDPSPEQIDKEIDRQEREAREKTVVLETDAGSRRQVDTDRVRKDGSGYGDCDVRDDRADDVPDSVHKTVRPSKPRGLMVSEYRDYLARWADHDPTVVRAFELTELYLYHHNFEDEQLNVNDPRKIKDYLFDSLGSRSGGVCPNLWGFLLKWRAKGRQRSVLWQAANDSFRNPLDERKDESGEKTDDSLKLDDGTDNQALRDLTRFVSDLWHGHWEADYTDADRIVICMAIFRLAHTDPRVTALSDFSKSSLYNYRRRYFGELFAELKDRGFEIDDISAFLDRQATDLLKDVIENSSDPRFKVFLQEG